MKPKATLSVFRLLILAAAVAGCATGGVAPPPAAPSEPVPAVAPTPALPPPVAAVGVPVQTVPAEPDEVAVAPLEAQLGVDPAVTVGKLDNGLTYYIRRHQKPEKRAELWLVVNAGSMQEDEDQQGLAHFTEHMAFNGTEHFHKQELVDYLEKIGMRFGPDLNAYTSFDQTVYQLKVPTDDTEIVDTAFLILRDWAAGLSFDHEEVDKERGVVIEEWRLGRGAEARMRDQQMPILFEGSRYAERLPIGKVAILEHAPPEALKRFYHDWYRPDLMAVVAVGDFDPVRIQQLIEEQFGGLRGPAEERPRRLYPVPGHPQTLFGIATDPEATRTTVAVFNKLDKQPEGRVGDYRRSLVEGIFHGMLNARLDEIRRRPDPPFLYAFSTSGGFVRTADVYYQLAGVEDGGIDRGLDALLSEVVRVQRHGFAAAELERMKQDVLRQMETAYREREQIESRSLVAEYTRNFLQGEPIPGVAAELALVRRFLPTITLEEVNELAGKATSDQNRVILVGAPEKEGVPVPNEEELLGVFRGVEAKDVVPWVDQTRDEPLLAERPQPGAVVEERQLPEIGVTWWRLGNGAQVVLKPTDFKNDEILLTAFSPGGSSLVSDPEYPSAMFADRLVSESGLGSFTAVELEKALAGKVVSVTPTLDELEEGIEAHASPDDLETMLQLVYLTFTAPRLDRDAATSFLGRARAMVENRLASPEAVFADRLQEVLSQGHWRRRPLSQELLSEVDPTTAFQVFQDRFADADDFTFVLVGRFAVDEVRALVETYLGGLPTQGRQETWRDVGVTPPPGIVEERVVKGLEPKSRVTLVFTGDSSWSPEAEHAIHTLAGVLRIRLREVLREDMGGTYGVGVSGAQLRWPKERYRLNVSFGCDPTKREELVAALLEELQALRQGQVDAENLEKVREGQLRERETDLEENPFWAGALAYYYRNDLDPRRILDYEQMVRDFTLDQLVAAARRYLSLDRYVIAVLDPEPSGAVERSPESR